MMQTIFCYAWTPFFCRDIRFQEHRNIVFLVVLERVQV